MINLLGKSLVLVHTFLALALLGWALAVFFQFNDYGWAVPRKDILDKSIPSEYDKTLATLNEAVRGRDLMLAPIDPARKALAEAEGYFPKNHLYYVAELKRLRSSPDPIEVKEIKIGGTPLDTPKKPLGKPVLDEPVEGVTKSYTAYLADLKKVHEDIDQEEKAVREITEKTKEITYTLTGKDDAGEQVRPGLYDLIDREYKTQVANKAEREYLQPMWAQKINEARDLNQRRANLEATLKKVRK
jgi:hypothetical protein